ncbi:hypothetical protein Mmc1_2079 [Magnetococcus marinus MC-1]|uniref:Uncharacterized protein n=1 Tax=Magnetococcus marinus (strain ATCC BAA-1437 / JCM 17883 / MC-1) TaxID=156889 RepID=A0L9D7_MAGMM|nr:hypothetical protein [Magnetococcus marinus]ABK44580.1 hypothetical protein Mmc1_2079 [Magnetococcus marinus MC-1]
MTPLNYSSQAVADLKWWALQQEAEMPQAAAIARELADKILSAVKFILPEGGKLFDRSEPTQAEMDLLRLPFENLVLEFRAKPNPNEPTTGYHARPVPKRLVYAESTDERDDAPGGVIVWPIDFEVPSGRFVPSPVGALVVRGLFEEFTPSEIRENARRLKPLGLQATRGTTRATSLALGEAGTLYWNTRKQYGLDPQLAFEQDVTHEITAVRHLCAVLNCSNVGTDRVGPTAYAQRKRAQQGKKPLYEYKILKIDSQQNHSSSNHQGGSHASPRVHLRRGHIRRLENRSIWVNACVVGNKQQGLIHKAYAVG